MLREFIFVYMIPLKNTTFWGYCRNRTTPFEECNEAEGSER